MSRSHIEQIADLLTDDPDILNEATPGPLRPHASVSANYVPTPEEEAEIKSLISGGLPRAEAIEAIKKRASIKAGRKSQRSR